MYIVQEGLGSQHGDYEDKGEQCETHMEHGGNWETHPMTVSNFSPTYFSYSTGALVYRICLNVSGVV